MDKTNNSFCAVILAAGIGSRLQPLTFELPKALLQIGNNPIIYHQISSFLKCGINRIYVIIGYKSLMIMEYLSKTFPYPSANIAYIYNYRYKETNTAYSLWLASSYLSEYDTFIVNGDVLITPETISRMKYEQSCMGLVRHSCREEEVKLELQGKRIINIGKGLDIQKASGEYIGIAKFDKNTGKHLQDALNETISSGKINLYYDDVIRMLLSNLTINSVDLTDLGLIEIDTIEDLNIAKKIYNE